MEVVENGSSDFPISVRGGEIDIMMSDDQAAEVNVSLTKVLLKRGVKSPFAHSPDLKPGATDGLTREELVALAHRLQNLVTEGKTVNQRLMVALFKFEREQAVAELGDQ